MSDASIQLVVFDLGRVLIQIADDWQHASELAGVDGQLPDPDPVSRAVFHELSVLCEIGAIDHDMFCRRLGHLLNVDDAIIHRVSDAFLIGPYPGVQELVQELSQKGVKTACLSNTNANHWDLMSDPSSKAHMPLKDMTHRFASHLAYLRKPDDAIFAHVDRKAGIEAENVLFFDDSAENIAAAETHGWNAVKIDNREDPIEQIRTALKTFGVL